MTKRFLWIAGGLSLIATGAFAQASIDPGRVQQQFAPPAIPREEPRIVVPEIPQQVAPAEAEQIRVTVSDIRVEGASAYPAGAFSDLVAPLLNKEIPLADLFKLADAITARYRADDYILSRAVVPAQRLDNGVVRIQVVEGFISDVVFEGEKTALMESQANRILESRPLTGATLERYLLLINDTPGVGARAVLAPASNQTGGSQLTLVTTMKPVDAFVAFDNRGSRYIGPYQFTSGISLNGLLGMGDRTAVNYATVSPSTELRYVLMTEEMPLSDDGLVLALNAGYSASRPGFTLRQQDTRAIGTTLGAKVSYPVVRSRADTVTVHSAFHYLNSRTVMNDDPLTPPSSEDRIRALRAGLLYDSADIFAGHNLIGFELSRGLYVFNATSEGRSNPSRTEGRNDFRKLTVELSRRQDLDPLMSNLGLYVAGSAQTALGQALLSSEQFGLGGSTFGRGYDPSEITGDSGFATKAELQYNLGVEALEGIMQFYGFYDFGMTRNDASNISNGKNKATLASAGGGVRFDVFDTLSGSLELAQVLTRSVATDAQAGKEPKPLKLFFNLVARY